MFNTLESLLALVPLDRVKARFVSPPVPYVIAAGVFLALSFVTLWSFLVGQSYFIYRDLTWPTDSRDLLTNLFYSVDLESFRRAIYLGPIFAVVKVIGLSSLDAEKVLFVMIRFLTGFLAFFSIYKFISSHAPLEGKSRFNSALFFVAIVGGFFYAYNPIATTMVSPTLGFAFSYALIPPTFYFFDKALRQRKFQNTVIASIFVVLSIAGTMQYLILLPLFLLGPWLAFNLLIPANRRLLKGMAFTSVEMFLLVLTFSSYWILPSIASSQGGVPLEPQQYIISSDFLDIISKKLSLDNVIRLMGDWWPRVELTPLFDDTAWTFLTFAIPITMVSFAVFQKQSTMKFYMLSFLAMGLLIMFFQKGTQPPISSLYPSLFDIPVVGWMFRIPSKFGMILAFTATMVISLGFYNLIWQGNLQQRFRKILRYALPIVFLICVSIVSWPMFTGDLGGVFSENRFPQTTLEPTPATVVSLTPQNQNIAVEGGLDNMQVLNLANWNSTQKSVIFLDQQIGTNQALDISSYILSSSDKESLLMHYLPKDAVILSPFDNTKRYAPTEVFSRGRTDYAINGSFPYNYLDKFSINSRDLDYGKGLVFTTSHDTLDLPFSIPKSGQYEVFVRALESHRGGMLKVHSDESSVWPLSTLSPSDAFAWKHLGTTSYSTGRHTITLESERGLNAINLVVIMPTEQLKVMQGQANEELGKNDHELVYALTPNNFASKGVDIGESVLTAMQTGNSSTSYSGVIDIPKSATQMTLQFWARQSGNSNSSSLQLNSLEIVPTANQKLLVHSHFESGGNTSEAFGYNPENLKISIDSNAPLSGFKSLHARLADNANSSLGNLSSGLVPLSNARGLLSTQMFASTHDLDYLTAKIAYFDHNKVPISENELFTAAKNTPKTLFDKDIKIPNNAAFVQLQFTSKMNQKPTSYYSLDVITINQRYPDRPLSFEMFGNSHPVGQDDFAQLNEESLKFDINDKDSNQTAPGDWHLFESIPIDVTGGLRYRYTADLKMSNVDSVFSRFAYFSDNVVRAAGKSDSSDQTLVLPQGSKVSSSFETINSSPHTIGILAKTCEGCSSSLKIKIGDSKEDIVPIQNGSSQFTWLFLNKEIPSGNTNVEITSVDGASEIKGMMIFSNPSRDLPDAGSTQIADNRNLGGSSHPQVRPINIIDYFRVNPVTYNARVNASEPFVLRLDLPYASMWRAYANDQEYTPTKVFSANSGISSLVESAQFPATNGFLIDKTGDVNVTIKFLPHEWFNIGLLITGLALALSFGYIIWRRWTRQSSIKSPIGAASK